MTPAQKRLLFPLRGPRALTLAWSPVHLWCAAIAGYHEALFAVFTPGAKR